MRQERLFARMLREAEAAAATVAAQDFITTRQLPGGKLLGMAANRALSRLAHKHPVQLAIAAGVALVAFATYQSRRGRQSDAAAASPAPPTARPAASVPDET